MSSISIKECLSFGWRTVRSRPWLFVSAGLLLFFVNFAVSLLQSLFEMGAEHAGDMAAAIVGILSALLGMAASFLIAAGETSFFLRAHDDVKTASLKDLWHPASFWNYAGASLLSGLLVVLGLILLIVPGFIIGTMLMFVGYAVIEEKLRPVAAIKRSMALTKGNRWNLFFLSLAIFGINVLGFLALIVGLFVTIPLSFLAVTHAYRVLSRADNAPTEAAVA